EVAERTEEPGVAVGLAWTPNGGDILFIESTRMAGKKNLTLTGHLGEVMKESAQAALSYVRSRATRLGIAPDFFENTDIHIHVPHGAIPKDGPSAGVTIVTSLASLLTGRHVRPNVAMTGEITLRGKVEPVGGIKEKVLAAKRAGIETVILPRRNEKDLEDVPEPVRRAMRFVFVDTVEEVLEHAPAPAQAERRRRGREPRLATRWGAPTSTSTATASTGRAGATGPTTPSASPSSAAPRSSGCVPRASRPTCCTSTSGRPRSHPPSCAGPPSSTPSSRACARSSPSTTSPTRAASRPSAGTSSTSTPATSCPT